MNPTILRATLGIGGLVLGACASAGASISPVVEIPRSEQPQAVRVAAAKHAAPPPAPAASATAEEEKTPPSGEPADMAIARCCAALPQTARSAPIDQQPYYLAAAQACNGMRRTPNAQLAFGQIRMFLAGARAPAACR